MVAMTDLVLARAAFEYVSLLLFVDLQSTRCSSSASTTRQRKPTAKTVTVGTAIVLFAAVIVVVLCTDCCCLLLSVLHQHSYSYAAMM